MFQYVSKVAFYLLTLTRSGAELLKPLTMLPCFHHMTVVSLFMIPFLVLIMFVVLLQITEASSVCVASQSDSD